MNKTSNLEEQLMLLKMMTVRTGAIHEAQALQLKTWPRLIPNVEASVAKVDTETKTVIFQLKGHIRLTKKTKEMFIAIDRWVKLLLWDNTKVVFIHKNKTLYRSEGSHV